MHQCSRTIRKSRTLSVKSKTYVECNGLVDLVAQIDSGE